MNRKFRNIFLLLTITSFCSDICGQVTEEEMAASLKEELLRCHDFLKKLDTPVYYIALRGSMKHAAWENFSNFKEKQNERKNRFWRDKVNRIYHFYIDMRIGSPNLDQRTYVFRQDYSEYSNRYRMTFRLDLKAKGMTTKKIKSLLWETMNTAYGITKDEYIKKANPESENVRSEKNIFHLEPKGYKYKEAFESRINHINFDSIVDNTSDAIIAKIKAKNKNIKFSIKSHNVYDRNIFISTEGIELFQNKYYYQTLVLLKLIDNNNTVQFNYIEHYSNNPLDDNLQNDLDQKLSVAIDQLEIICQSKSAEPYAGPAIFTGEAAAVFFHEVLGHRLESQRFANIEVTKTLSEKIGDRLLPPGFNIYFDPSIYQYKDYQLSGSYKYDDEGIPSEKVTVIEDGILKNFLNSRSTSEKIPKSNGHGRSDEIYTRPTSRQSNMIVEHDKTVSEKELRNMLLKEIKSKNLKYGYLFESVSGGHTSLSTESSNTIVINPIIVKKVYASGIPDEIVKDVFIIGTPLTVLQSVVATSDTYKIFRGMCGAESGNIPVSAVSPSILVSLVETQAKQNIKLKKFITQPSDELGKEN